MSEIEFITLINSNKRIIYNVCNNYGHDLSEKDLIQDILLQAWKSIKNWQRNCKFSTWLYNIARNVCVDAMRRKKTQPVIYYGLADYIDIAMEPNSLEILKQVRNALRYDCVINNIEEYYRTIFIMYIDGCSYEEISKQTGMPIESLRVKISRIKKQLRLRYGK